MRTASTSATVLPRIKLDAQPPRFLGVAESKEPRRGRMYARRGFCSSIHEMTGFASGEIAQPVLGRSCGQCSLCCKLPPIEDFAKPAGQWCKHCAPGNGGCTIYSQRPLTCQRFMCLWLTHRDLDDRWKPTTAKLLLYSELDGHRIVVHVDPGSPNRWRQEPYYSSIKRMSTFGIDQGAQVVVYIKDRAIVVLSKWAVDLGIVRLEDHIITKELNLPLGLPRDWEVSVVPFEDIPPEDRDKSNIQSGRPAIRLHRHDSAIRPLKGPARQIPPGNLRRLA